MPSSPKPQSPNWSKAQRHLAKSDPIMQKIISAVGPCMLSPRRDYFVKLCHSIFAQQLSTVVARTLFTRFCNHFPAKRPTPVAVIEFLQKEEEIIRTAGLSRQKRKYIHDLATHFHTKKVRTRQFASMEDEAIVQALLPIKGIGRWTVEMFLIFCLNRPNVFPTDDFGIRANIQKAYNLKSLPTKAQMQKIAEKWQPWRTIASWYLWRHGDLQKPRRK